MPLGLRPGLLRSGNMRSRLQTVYAEDEARVEVCARVRNIPISAHARIDFELLGGPETKVQVGVA